MFVKKTHHRQIQSLQYLHVEGVAQPASDMADAQTDKDWNRIVSRGTIFSE